MSFVCATYDSCWHCDLNEIMCHVDRLQSLHWPIVPPFFVRKSQLEFIQFDRYQRTGLKGKLAAGFVQVGQVKF